MNTRLVRFILVSVLAMLGIGGTCDAPSAAPVVDWAVGLKVGDSVVVSVRAHDPRGDSIRLRVAWGDGVVATTGFRASPCSSELRHNYDGSNTGEVIVQAIDMQGTISDPETTTVPIEQCGRVQWFWWNNPEDQGPPTTSPVIASDGTDECIYSGCEEDFKFYTIRAADGSTVRTAVTKFPEYVFTGHPAYCTSTGNIIVGSEEGELYAFNVNSLAKVWQWPNAPIEDSLKYQEWGAPAIDGNKIYIGCANDSMYYFQDLGSQGTRIAAYGVHAGILDAPAIDAQGNVYFTTDSGHLYKMDPNLTTPIWRARLQRNGDIHSPIIGADGTIYCTSDSFRLFSVNPANGEPNWTITLDGEASRPALGSSALFAGTSYGKVYSINPATGSVNWERQLDQSRFETTPIVVAGGYVYFQNLRDTLYCINQADGTVIWSCDCPRWLPRSSGGRARRLQLADYAPNPSILANGNIIVVGRAAVYCVGGYPERPLDPTAPWPKWQRSLSNAGRAGGER